jgi:outer membrane protein TolC
MTLKQAIALAMEQNPEVVLARLDEEKGRLQVDAVKEPLMPRLVAGSGLAWTSGFPLSIEGSAPSVVQARAIRSLFNLPNWRFTEQARLEAKSMTERTVASREEAALRTATLYLDLERVTRSADLTARQLESLQRIEGIVRMRIGEGRELEIEGKRSALNVAKAKRKQVLVENLRAQLSRSLAVALGLNPAEELRPAMEERPAAALPPTEQELVSQALKESPEIRRIETEIKAKRVEASGWRAMRYPKIDLVAQYALLSRFNNYDDFFKTFKASNWQLGASIVAPLWKNSSDEARAAQADVQVRRLQAQMRDARGRVESETRRAWATVAEAESGVEVSKLDLDLAREQVGVVLAQQEEGRAGMKQLEEARFAEQEKWQAFYDAGYELERARLEALQKANQLAAALR